MTAHASRVIVASRNPVKISAAREAFRGMFPSTEFSFTGLSVPSGVADQPMTDAETLQGARNRAQNARDAEPQADYWVGIEGGVDDSGDSMETFAWVVVLGRAKTAGSKGVERMGRARTAAFFQPEEVARLVRGGMELGPAGDQVFGSENSRQHSGSIGLLTGDLINRSAYYVPAVIGALIPFRNSALTFARF
ncbi:NTPase [Trichoderma reesei RUT C-30]|uniref:inosine/xanthosine triphosphatase n=1 Tax=Hypocrea jecorina (strain ATCC 56765 / BCRC 32924 / NRRL 11460 / Rut C-30) TaxID=1344414 RepID=A0A024SDZ7_HYPJR|nr:NTPase [Trichoderma reesei RUT C-30]